MRNRIKIAIGLFVAAILLTGTFLSFQEQPAAADQPGEILELPPLELQDKGNPELDSQLNQLTRGNKIPDAFLPSSEDAKSVGGEKVRVIVESLPGKSEEARLAADSHGNVETTYNNLIQMTVPVTRLNALTDNPSIRLIRMPMEPVFNAVISEGVTLHNADDWHISGYNGIGVKVAILDGGFTGYSSLLGTELPSSPVVQSFNAAYGINGTSVHGTACAEIVYDMAPGAQLYLVNFGTSVELGNAVDWLITQDVDIISASWGYPVGGPGDGTGPITSIVDTAKNAGILWVNAVGNHAKRHWQGDWINSDGDQFCDFNQSPRDEGNTISVNNGDTITIALKWDDSWGASGNDYDLLLFDNTGTLVDWSTRTQDGNDNPWEGLTYTADYTGNYRIAIGTLYPPVTNFSKNTIDNNYNHANSVYATDVDGDGDVDVLGASGGHWEITWWENDGNEDFSKHSLVFLSAREVYATDVDGDGDIDILGAGSNDIAWWENDGNENFTKHTIDSNFYAAMSVYATDVDGDGDVDVLGAAWNSQQFAWWENNGSENFTKHGIESNHYGANSIYATDVDGDGDIDVLGAAADTDYIGWWENDGNKNFTKNTIDNNYDGAVSVYATDVDGDGDIDVLGAAELLSDISWWENDGNKNFTKNTIDSNFGGAYSVYAADVEGDGDVDVLGAADGVNDICWWENDGSENFTKHYIDDNFVKPYSVYATDVDGDGDVDVLGAASYGNEIAWWEYESVPGVNFHLYSYYHDLEYQTASSSFLVPADSQNAMSVGAVFWNDASTLESFSSQGPTKNGQTKPDLVAPDGVSTASYGSSNGTDYLSGGTGFFGTSASAPYAAGAAALVKGRDSSYNATSIQSFLEGRAFDLGSAGKDNLYGSGRLDLGIPPVITSIAVKPPNPTIALGRVQQFIATGTYSDNLTADITDNVTWTSSNITVAIIAATGLTQSLNGGQAIITATSGNISGNTTLTVGPKVLDTLFVTPSSASIAKGRTQQFSANGTYSDNSTANLTANVTWSSSNTSVATANMAGLFLSHTEGLTIITANLSTVSGTANLTVTPEELDTIMVTPSSPSVAAGHTQQFSATGIYTDSSSANLTASVTWASANASVATINSIGLAQSFAEGQTLISATSGNISGNATLTVSAPVLDTVSVTPLNPLVVYISGDSPTVQFTATACYSDGSTTSVTGSANWSSSNTSVATIGPGIGLATTVAPGSTNIIATYNGTSGNTTLTVLPDTVAPVIRITSPTDGQVFSTDTTIVTGVIDDVNTSVNLTVITASGTTNTTLTIGAGGNFSQSITMSTGSNNILVVATDGVGNTCASSTITVTVNQSKPGITITQPEAGLVTGNSSQVVSGTVTGNVSSVNLIVNGDSQSVSVTGGSFSANITLVEGINIITVNAYPSGYEGESGYMGTSGVRTVALDTTPPVITINTPVPSSIFGTPGCTVTGTIDDPSVNTANLTLNGSPQIIPVAGGNFSQSVTLLSGNNTINVQAADMISNTGSANVTVTYDNTKPVVAITYPTNNTLTNNTSLNITGTINDTSITSATLYLNGSNQTITVSSGNFSANVTLAAGTNTIEVTASDGANNTGSSGVINVTLDTTAPTLTIGLNDPADSVTITVSSDEALSSAPSVSVNPSITMTQTGINKWTGTYGSSSSPITAGNYTVSVSGTDRAGNSANASATFAKATVTISDNGTATVTTETTTLEISTTSNVSSADISVTQHLSNPSGNVGTPSGADKTVGAFIEIVASPELRDNLEGIYIEIEYDEADLPAGTDESSLKLYLWDTVSGTWQVVPGSGVNTAQNYIYGTITHLSKYGGFGTATVTPPAPPPSGGGGGGGGGGGVPDGWTILSDVDTRGTFMYGATAMSKDKQCIVNIGVGVRGLNRVKQPLDKITMLEAKWSPEAPEGEEIVGKVYDIGPSGATFEPAITVSRGYDPETLSENVSVKEMYVAFWDGDQWVSLNGTAVDASAHMVSGNTTHFTKFALIGPPPSGDELESVKPTTTPKQPYVPTEPAKFEVSELTISPEKVKEGEKVEVSILVTNTGGRSGSYNVILKIDGIEEDSQEMSLGINESETAIFSIIRDERGSYEVDIGGQRGNFTVATSVASVIPKEETVIEEPDEEIIPEKPSIRWAFLGIIIGGVTILGVLFYLFFRQKRKTIT